MAAVTETLAQQLRIPARADPSPLLTLTGQMAFPAPSLPSQGGDEAAQPPGLCQGHGCPLVQGHAPAVSVPGGGHRTPEWRGPEESQGGPGPEEEAAPRGQHPFVHTSATMKHRLHAGTVLCC